MENLFVQKSLDLKGLSESNLLKVEKLCELIKDHEYKERIFLNFDYSSIKDEYIQIDNLPKVFDYINEIHSKYGRYRIFAKKDSIDLKKTPEDTEKYFQHYFDFKEYTDVHGELHENLRAFALYDSKNSFLDKRSMTKYLNYLYSKDLDELAEMNINYFKSLAANSDEFNDHLSYRMVKYNNIDFVRGITSVNRYYEYGVDFAFVISILKLHSFMKKNPGTNYRIDHAAINESKLDMFVSEKFAKQTNHFGHVSSSIKISTNDLGNSSLSFTSTITIINRQDDVLLLYPKKRQINDKELRIRHSEKPETVFEGLSDVNNVLTAVDNFIEEMDSIRKLKSPDELRVKILGKLTSKNSRFREIKKLSDIFSRKIDNEINNFAALLEMCNKAEQLDIEFDIKDKLRYIISDILFD